MKHDLLVFAPHPDDAELSCGGWLALAATRGRRTAVIDLTAGELATNGTPEVRAREAAAAAAVLGLSLRENLGLPDGGLRADDPDQTDALVRVLRTHRPGLVVAPWPDDRHPDHVAAGRLVERAVFFAGLVRHRPNLGEPWRPRRLLFYPHRQDVRADLVVDVGGVYGRKKEAIACHASQVTGGRPTLLNQPLGIEAFEVRDRYWGATVGVAYGEPYVIRGPVPVDDPVAHFEAHPAPPVLAPPR